MPAASSSAERLFGVARIDHARVRHEQRPMETGLARELSEPLERPVAEDDADARVEIEWDHPEVNSTTP